MKNFQTEQNFWRMIDKMEQNWVKSDKKQQKSPTNSLKNYKMDKKWMKFGKKTTKIAEKFAEKSQNGQKKLRIFMK